MNYFQNIFETAKEDARMNHTAASAEVATPNKSAYLYWIDGQTANKSVGPAISLKVNAGDEITPEVWAKFENKISYNRNLSIATIASFLGGNFAFTGGFEGFTTTQTANSFSSALTTGGLMNDTGDDTPFAYLNYILLGTDMSLLDADSKRVPLEAGFDPGEEALPNGHALVRLNQPIKPTQAGYLYIWLSNESENTKVWFDDFKVTHKQVLTTQATDYGVWGDVVREEKLDEESYRFGYQWQFAEKDEETGWSHFELREYDAVVGRWLIIDPVRQYFSPYNAMRSDPINSIDPDGGFDTKFGANWYAFWNGGGDVYKVEAGAHKGEWAVGNQFQFGENSVGVGYKQTFDWGIDAGFNGKIGVNFGPQIGEHISAIEGADIALASFNVFDWNFGVGYTSKDGLTFETKSFDWFTGEAKQFVAIDVLGGGAKLERTLNVGSSSSTDNLEVHGGLIVTVKAVNHLNGKDDRVETGSVSAGARAGIGIDLDGKFTFKRK